MKTDSLL